MTTPRRTQILLKAGITTLAVGAFMLDYNTPAGVLDWAIYMIPLILTWGITQTWFVRLTAGVCMLFAAIGFFVSAHGLSFPLDLLDRLIGIGTIGAVTMLMLHARQSDQQLRTTNEKLTKIFDNAPECIKVLDRRGRVLEMNQSGLRILEADSLNQVLGQCASALVKETDRPAFDALVDAAYAGKSGSLVFEATGLKGKQCWLETFTTPLRDKAGNVLSVLGVTRDITNRMEAEQALQRFETIFNRANWGMVTADPDTHRITNANPAFARMHGYTVDEIIGMNLADTFAPEARAALPGHAKVAHQKGWLIYDAMHVRKDGSLFPCRTNVSVFKNKEGRITFRAATFDDMTDIWQAHKTLREQENQLRLFIEHAPAALAMFDRDMRYLHASRRWRTDYGLEDRDLRGQSHYDIFPEIPERWKEAHRRGLAGETVREDIDRFERADGSKQWLRWEIRPWQDAAGTVGGIVIFAEDITAREEAEEQVRTSERRLRDLIDGLGQNLFVGLMTPDGTLIDVNKPALTVAGLKPEDVVGKPVEETYWLAYSDEVKRRFREAIQMALRGESSRYDMQIRVADGQFITIDFTLNPLRDATGRIVLLVGSASDITERKMAEMALRESEERFSRAFQSSPLGIAISTMAEGRFIEVNGAFLRMFDRSRAEVIDRTSIELGLWFDPVDRARDISRLVSEGRLLNLEREFPRKSGGTGWTLCSAELIEMKGQKCLVSMFSDITERKRAQEKLELANERLRELAFRIQTVVDEEQKRIARELHDEFGQVLTALKFDLKKLDGQLRSGSTAGTSTNARAKIHSLFSLVDSLIDSSRKLASSLRPSMLDDLGLADALQFYASQFHDRTKIQCDVSISPRVSTLGLNGTMTAALFRISQELLTNVARHAQASRVSLSLQDDAQSVILTVADNGRGLSPEDTDKRSSYGLLGIRERVELLDGTCTIDGRPGKGTTVTVRLPVAAGS